jgi:hypothetical protein
MSKRIIDRRAFLRSAATSTALVAVVSGVTVIAASDGAWAMDLKALGDGQARSLLLMMRALYPHDALGDVYYATSVEELDAKAAKDPALAKQLKEGLAGLDKALGVPFHELSEGTQVEVLQGIERTPFFQAVRGHTVVALYNNKLVWADFGYQGSSFEYGGYLLRGFQDAGWTMQPDAAASPAPYMG